MSAAALRANFLGSQRNGQPHREFARRAMAGGVQGYIAFLRGKRVTWCAPVAAPLADAAGKGRKAL